MRNHPAITYYQSGVPIVIAGDDPGSFGYNDLTVDYYLAFMAWGLSVYDLREIANNSIRYSSVPESVKLTGFTKFSAAWGKFVNTYYDKICSSPLANSNLIRVTSVYPSYGPNDVSKRITIYGNGFEGMLCVDIGCYFDDVKSKGYLNKINELVCETPLGFKSGHIAKIDIVYSGQDSGVIITTRLQYTFLSSSLIKVIYDGPTSTSSAPLNRISNSFILTLFLLINIHFC